MDKFNLSVYVEQLNHEADSTTVNKWEENEELALNIVIDPNTEFKSAVSEKSAAPHNPSHSYGLDIESTDLEEGKVVTEQQPTEEKNLVAELIPQLQLDCLSRELEETLEGFKVRQKRNISDSSHVAKVHVYSSTHLPTQEEQTHHEVDNSVLMMLSTETSVKAEPLKLLKYPSDRITVVTEKCSYPVKSPDSDHRPKALAGKDSILPVASGRYLSAALSHESITTASIASDHVPCKSNLTSTKSPSSMVSELNCRLDHPVTMADQLAWEFRRARDRVDTASNISGCSRFELDSSYSEKAETMSTISDVSGYEEEMFRIKRLLLLDSAATPTPSSGEYEKRTETLLTKENADMQIHRLAVQLQNAQEEKEKYRIEALEAETRISLEWQEKYQEALRQKAHLEGRLETVQAEMTTLVSGQNEVLGRAQTREQELKLKTAADSKAALQEFEKLALNINRLQQTVREADSQSEDLALQLELRDSEITQLKGAMQASEDANEKLRIELQELKIEAESKDESIQSLKSKISDQHIECQSLLQAKLKAENNLTSLKNEIEMTRKSGYWYRDQLHACQATRMKVQQELMASQAEVVSHSCQNERMKGEIAKLHQEVETTQYRAVREKEALMRKLEVIQADMLEREATIFSQIHNESTVDTVNNIAAKLKMAEEEKARLLSLSDTAVQELKEEVASLKNEMQTKETALDAAGTENAQLMTRMTMLQKTLNEKELALQLLENKYKNIEMSYNHSVENLKLKEQTLLELKNEKVAVEVALAAAGREKTEVDMAVSKLKDDFARITTSYQVMKAELREKEKQITNLKADINEMQRENKSHIEKMNELEKFEEAYKRLQSRISQTQALEQQTEDMSKANMELKLKVNELKEAHSYVKQQMSMMRETIAVREEQLLNQTHIFEVHSEELKAKEQSLAELANEKAAHEEHVRRLQAKIQELVTQNEKLAAETASVQKQLSSASGAIEQFNLLCRRSEEEKSLLKKQIKKMVEEHGASRTLQNVPAESACPSPEMLPAIQKPLSSHENGCVETKLCHLYGLLQIIESKLTSLLSEGCDTQEKDFQKQQVNIIPINSVNEFDSFETVLVNIRDSISKVLEWRDKLTMEMETEKQSNEALRNELSDLKQGTGINILNGEKLNKVSYDAQAEKVNTESTGSQTVNNDILNYKEQIDAFQKEITKLKGCLKMSDIEHCERRHKYESNVRTLLKKVKEHMRGRKHMEQALEELRGKTEENMELFTLNCELSKLQAELEVSKKSCEEQKRIADRNQEALLVLEKEQGKLAQSCSISWEKLPPEPESEEVAVSNEFDQKARELQLLQTQGRITELEEEVRKSHIIIKELRKEIFTEKCETSQLRKQLASVQMGLETANDVLDTKKVDLGRTESLCCVLRTNISHLKKQLETEQQAHEECKLEVEKLREDLEETRAKDPVLAAQIKMLSCHLHQKSQEAAGLEDKIKLSEERWLSTETGLQRSMSALQDELNSLRMELDLVRSDKFMSQTQVAELRAALHSSVEQNKVLRLKLETFGCESKDRLPDLTSSLPLAPLKYDETQIAELLHQSTVLPHNKPLSNLQSCLDSLKQEMATLQRQLSAKTSVRDQIDIKTEHSVVKNV